MYNHKRHVRASGDERRADLSDRLRELRRDRDVTLLRECEELLLVRLGGHATRTSDDNHWWSPCGLLRCEIEQAVEGRDRALFEERDAADGVGELLCARRGVRVLAPDDVVGGVGLQTSLSVLRAIDGIWECNGLWRGRVRCCYMSAK